MDNEPYRILSHDATVTQVLELKRRAGGASYMEFPLPDGKVADVAWLDANEDVYIFEVKTTYKASLAQNAYEKYWRFCNYLFLVVPGMSAMQWGRLKLEMCWMPQSSRVGIMGADPYRMPVFHAPTFHAMRPEHRASIIQTFRRMC